MEGADGFGRFLKGGFGSFQLGIQMAEKFGGNWQHCPWHRASVVPIQFRVAMDVRLVAGNRGGRVLVINGYRYHKHRNANETIHWQCWRKECNARVRTNRFNIEDLEDANEIHVLFHEEHNHETDDKMIDRAVLRETMRGEVLDNPAHPIKRVYDATVANVHRRQAQGGGDRPQIDNFRSFRTILNRTKVSQMPEIPAAVEDVNIAGPWAETWLHDRFLLHQDNDWGISIFATDANLRALRRCGEVYMDGTFRSCPAPYNQFFTVLGRYHGWVIPLVDVLMENKGIGHYRQVLAAISRHVRRVTHHRWRPRMVICDFEQALITAVETDLPHAQVKGCYFHFTQNLWRRIQELGLAGPYHRDRDLRKCLRKVMAIGYLPLALVQMNFNLLRAARRTNNLINRYPALMDFFAYVMNTYVNGTFPPALWSVYDRNMDVRTNNVESK